MHFRNVAVAISGGVDSAVAAYLLKQKGFKICGVFMKNWDEFDENGLCSGEQDWKDAQFVSEKLQIPIVQINFVKYYWNNVFKKFLHDYEIGLTPNPDILCNRFIKFDQFFKYAMEDLKVDAIATGHYAQTSFGSYLQNYSNGPNVKLYQAVDDFKDQTFFLCNINQNALRKTMFPIGTYLKKDVKEIAQKAGLSNIASKRESTGICFIGSRNFKKFITEYIETKPGNLVDIDTGQIVGRHEGIHQWTIGQRCCISGFRKPYFVARKIVDTNTLLVAAGTDHHSLFSQHVFTSEPFWLHGDPTRNGIVECQFRFQHTKPLVNCKVSIYDNGLYIHLSKPLRALTPGQYAVFYLNRECLGCARIIAEADSMNVNVMKL